jgi:hypothetical protein
MESVTDRKEEMHTKASSHDDIESNVEYGKTELPPLYVDIQDEIERNLNSANQIFSQLKKM